MVRNGDMSGGELVSFLLYLQSLSDAFATIGWVYSSLTQAVGAADKVFELLNRKPRFTPPSPTSISAAAVAAVGTGPLGIAASKTRVQRVQGLEPATARGEIVLENVVMYYPARPHRRILDGISLKVEPGR
jgi:ATP-binding cassette, subfamily B (MDR/TAP), member 9